MVRLFGRAPRGERAYGSAPFNHGPNISVAGAIRLDGISAAMQLEGAFNGNAFLAFVTQILAPSLRPDDVVVMDNLPSHKVSGVEDAIVANGARVLYLPPYSPDFNPIEQAWSKFKGWLRGQEARTRETLSEAISQGLDRITAQDAIGWFKRCGYV